jgi:hypothetical protein
MKTTKKQPKYVEWLNAEDMHQASRNWLSELNFIKDEQHFLEDLIKSYTLQLIDNSNFEKSKKIVDGLNKLQKKNKSLIKAVNIHESDLKIMVDGIDQIKEEQAYKNKHRELIIYVSKYLKDYRALKAKLFDVIKAVMKKGKQKRLLSET